MNLILRSIERSHKCNSLWPVSLSSGSYADIAWSLQKWVNMHPTLLKFTLPPHVNLRIYYVSGASSVKIGKYTGGERTSVPEVSSLIPYLCATLTHVKSTKFLLSKKAFWPNLKDSIILRIMAYIIWKWAVSKTLYQIPRKVLLYQSTILRTYEHKIAKNALPHLLLIFFINRV
jgi:hypothetical protein